MLNDDVANRVSGRELGIAYMRTPSSWRHFDRLTLAATNACWSRRRAEALADRIERAGGERIDPADLVAAAYVLERAEAMS